MSGWMIAEWCQANLRTEKNEPLDFIKFPFLIEVYNDVSKEIIVKKCSQVGISTMAMNRLLWLSKHIDGLTAIYTLPTSNDVSDFTQGRFDPVVKNSGIFSDIEIDNVGLKRIENVNIYFRGTGTEREALSIPSDYNIIDELNFSKQSIVEAYEERLSASPLQWKLKISHPTLPNTGISSLYDQSTQKEWYVKCLAGHEQVIREDNIIDGEYRCLSCRELLDRTHGRWVAKYPERTIQGYHFSQLMSLWIPATEILRKKDVYEYKRDYYNFVLGEDFVGGETTITRADILSILINSDEIKEKADERVVIGVDWGDTSWAVVLKGKTIIYLEKITGDTRKHPIRVLELMEKFNAYCIADFGYGDTKNKYLIDNKPGSVWMCVYTDGKMYPEWDSSKHIVRIDRNTSLYETCEDIRGRHIKLVNNEQVETFIKHFSNLGTEKVMDNKGGVKTQFVRTGDDHYCHALNYARLMGIKRKDDWIFTTI